MKKNNQNELPKCCLYCEHSTIINDESNVLCERRGIVNSEYCCRKFFYDPLKRVPKPQPPLPQFSKEEMSL